MIERLKLGFTIPTHFGNSSIAVCVYTLFVLLYGWRSHFLIFERSPSSSILRVIVTSFVAPALLEEAFFRVLLLPYPYRASDISAEQYFWSIISLFLFVVYHPLNAITAFPQGKKTFFDRRFLILATALGITCTITYWQTGSIWLPILIHWLTVVIWLLCFGGLNKLGLNQDKNKDLS